MAGEADSIVDGYQLVPNAATSLYYYFGKSIAYQ